MDNKPKLRPCLTAAFYGLGLLLFLVSGGCYHQAYKNLPEGKEVSMDLTTFSFGQGEHPFDQFHDYRIVPGDLLDVLYEVETWSNDYVFKLAMDQSVTVRFINAPELSETQKIRPDGKITLPYIGDIAVVGKTVDELTEELKKQYADVLQSPEVMVLVPDFRAAIQDFKNDLHTSSRGLSRLVTVRPDGYVTFPMVGDIFVSGKTMQEVGKTLNDKYAQKIPGIHCDLFLERGTGSLVFISGQVRSPGVYPITRPISLIEALTLSGGYTPAARLDSIIVARKHDNAMVATRIDLAKDLAFSKESSFFYLQPNDIVFVPTKWIHDAAEVARTIGDIIYFRGWSVGAGFNWQLYNAPTKGGSTTTTTTVTPVP